MAAWTIVIPFKELSNIKTPGSVLEVLVDFLRNSKSRVAYHMNIQEP